MDFSAWFEVYPENRWWVFDARHNTPKVVTDEVVVDAQMAASLSGAISTATSSL